MELPLLGCVRARAELVVFEYAYSPRHGVGIGSHGTRLGGGGVAMKMSVLFSVREGGEQEEAEAEEEKGCAKRG